MCTTCRICLVVKFVGFPLIKKQRNSTRAASLARAVLKPGAPKHLPIFFFLERDFTTNFQYKNIKPYSIKPSVLKPCVFGPGVLGVLRQLVFFYKEQCRTL